MRLYQLGYRSMRHGLILVSRDSHQVVRAHGFHTTTSPILSGALLTPNYLTCIFRFGVGEQFREIYTDVRSAATSLCCRLRMLCYTRVLPIGFEPITFGT